MNDFQKYDLLEFARRYDLEKHGLIGIAAALLTPADAGTTWIAGGSVRNFAIKQPIDSDVDFFFRHSTDRDAFIRRVQGMTGYRKVKENEKIHTFTVEINEKKILCQAVGFAYYPDMAACLDTFDFTVTQFATDGHTLVTGPYSLFDLARKRIAIHKISYGASSVRRLLKYAAKGFTVCQGAAAELLRQCGAGEAIIDVDTVYVD